MVKLSHRRFFCGENQHVIGYEELESSSALAASAGLPVSGEQIPVADFAGRFSAYIQSHNQMLMADTDAEVGNSLMSVLAPVLKEISDKLKSLAEWWNNLGGPMQQMIVKIALVAAACDDNASLTAVFARLSSISSL